jgi:hypothetical protein
LKPKFILIFFINFLLIVLSLVVYTNSLDHKTIVSADTSNNLLDSKSHLKIWSSDFTESHWRKHWQIIKRGSWGIENYEIQADPSGKFQQILRVYYPANSASPTVTKKQGNPPGGTQFYAQLNLPPQDSLTLSYYVRFSENFDFVKGGKLPGLFGGVGNNGGDIPDGTDGFSTRYMWRKRGDGEIYAYLPSSKKNHGTSIGRGTWQFVPGKWYHLEQKIILNEPGKNNGSIQVWVDDKKVLEQNGLMFRTTDTLKVDGILFSTFFGGGDSSWATRQDVYADFADFSVLQ